MLGVDDYSKVILESPIPCIFIELDKLNNDKMCKVKIIWENNKVKEISNKKTRESNEYYIDLDQCSYLEDVIKNKSNVNCNIYIEELNSFYEVDIQYIKENKYVVWFSKKIDIDEEIVFLLNEMGIYLWRKDIKGRYVYLSKSHDKYEKSRMQNIVGKNDFDIFSQEIAKAFTHSDKELLSDDNNMIESISFFDDTCFQGINKVLKDKQNKLIGTIGVGIDRLQFSHRENISDSKVLDLIGDNIPDSIFFKDKNGIFRYCNKVFAEYINLDKKDIIGKTEEEINTPNYKISKYEEEEKEIIKNRERKLYFSTSTHKDGRKKYLETIKVPFLDEHNMAGGVLGISRDISHRKESELEFERLRMEFFANLSHEFKTPLNLIFSSIQLMESIIDKNSDQIKYKKYTRIIKQNGYRLLKIVNNLIDSTRLNSGCLDCNLQNYDIVKFIESICDSVQHYAKEQGINLIFDTELEERIMAFDLEQMERIILNLISNAIKYNKENGNIYLKLEFDKDKVYIKVKDNGVGIPEDKLEDIFKLFKQINNRMTKLSEGSGIGLSLIKLLVELHNGEISVYSENGVGSEFKVMIPTTICEENAIEKNIYKYNKYVDNIDIEFSDIYTSIKEYSM